MEEFLYVEDEVTFNKLVNDGYMVLKNCTPYILLNKKDAKFDRNVYENVVVSNTMHF